MDTNSYIYRQGAAPETRAAVSQKNRIYAKSVAGGKGGQPAWDQIGVSSSFEVQQSRSAEPIRGIGFGDQIAELVPTVSEPVELSINRFLLYTASMFEVLGYSGGASGLVRALKHHQWPFDMKQELVMSAISSEDPLTVSKNASIGPTAYYKAIFTYYEACWMTSYSVSYQVDQAQVEENISIAVTDIIDGDSDYGVVLESGNKKGSMRFGSGLGTQTPEVLGV